MRAVTIRLNHKGKISLEANDFANDLQELFYVLATSTRQIAQIIEDGKEKESDK
ncbi:hypothetical protein KDN24_06655 [Bacillus sp. Bva_UNVM-123]|uniref:hypothetical protein n=1 Tax=Bacillus sp. Bva_UNVM-123 TaxID=2829798 RepID=UPI00391F2F1D